MLTSIFLRFVARNVDGLIGFLNKLDAELDTFLAKHDSEVAGFEQDIKDLLNDAEAEAKRILDEAEAAAADLRDEITGRVKKAATVAAIKAALPTATSTN